MTKNFGKFLLSIMLMFLSISCSQIENKIVTLESPVETPMEWSQECLPPKETFAYPVYANSEGTDSFLPLEPWIESAPLPENFANNYNKTVIARVIGQKSELWIPQNVFDSFLGKSDKEPGFLIYQVREDSWKFIPAEIENTGIYVREIFVTKDGTVWGQNIQNENQNLDIMPILSKLNERKNAFELVGASKGIPALWKNSQDMPGIWSQVFLDRNDIFWIFAHTKAIYSFDPQLNQVVQHSPISGVVTSITMAPNDGIYYKSDHLYLYSPPDKTSHTINVPLEPWPKYQTIFLDAQNRLWLDNLGWLAEDGKTWYQIHRSPLFISDFVWSEMEYRWKTGTIALASSDGMLWFYSENGMISLDPDKGKWCWFTTYQSKIVEDADHNLWMIADGKLYKYPLQP